MFYFRFASVHLKIWRIVASVLFALMASTYSLKEKKKQKTKTEKQKTRKRNNWRDGKIQNKNKADMGAKKWNAQLYSEWPYIYA